MSERRVYTCDFRNCNEPAVMRLTAELLPRPQDTLPGLYPESPTPYRGWDLCAEHQVCALTGTGSLDVSMVPT